MFHNETSKFKFFKLKFQKSLTHSLISSFIYRVMCLVWGSVISLLGVFKYSHHDGAVSLLLLRLGL